MDSFGARFSDTDYIKVDIDFNQLGLGEYNEDNIRKLQKKYLRAQDVDGIYGTDTGAITWDEG